MPESWRLIPYGAFSGAMNMAIDEAILEAHIAGETPPTLRLYKFDPPTVTIGLSQKMALDVVANIRTRGFDVVRRPTGGRAVLHIDDLTYSFVGTDVSANGFLSTSVTESYKQICEALLEAFTLLGVETELGSAHTPYRHLQDCFKATTGCDLHHQGTKIIGSAQTRRRGGVLQHGSVPLNQEQHLMSQLLNEPTSEQRHINLNEVAGRQLSVDELTEGFKKGFEHRFCVPLTVVPLSTDELDRARELSTRFEMNYQPAAASP